MVDKSELVKFIDNLSEKKSKFYFVVTNMGTPSSSLYEIYFHAKLMKDMGYDVTMLTDEENLDKDNQPIKPDWLTSDMVDISHVYMGKIKTNLSPIDVVVIPEIFTNIMEQLKNAPAIKVGFIQSIDYLTNALMPSITPKKLGIDNLMFNSENTKNLFIKYFGDNYNFFSYKIGIPDYFNYKDELKKPIISLVGRNANDIKKIIKLFYVKYPHYNWVVFDNMVTDSKPPQALNRKDYAQRLKENVATVWVDRISSFGTLPLEAMKAKNVVIGFIPDIIPDYLLDEQNNIKVKGGIWVDDFYKIPEVIGEVLTKFLDNTIDDEFYNEMDEMISEYSIENSKKQVEDIYDTLLETRKEIIEGELEKINNINDEEQTNE